MKKIFTGVIVGVLALMLLTLPVLASIDIQGVDYNFNAAENEWALRVRWTGRPAFEIKANEFYLERGETTITDVEDRIQEKFNDLLVEDEKLKDIDSEDLVHQDPPVLSPSQEIVIIRNQEYLRSHKAFFRIHIYSLDNLDTPESELRFTTRFQNPFAGPIPDDWWQ